MPSAAVSATMDRPELGTLSRSGARSGWLHPKDALGMEYTDVLRCLSIEDPQLAEHLATRDEIGSDVLDPKTVALARLAALVAMGGALPTYSALTEAAIGRGATPDEIVEVLVAIVPTVGLPRAVSAAPSVAMALGYDVADALE